MAIAFRANGSAHGATNPQTTTAFNTQVGDVVVVSIAIKTTTVFVSTLTDLAGNTYTFVNAVNNGTSSRHELWQTTASFANASNKVTSTLSTTDRQVVEASSYSGVGSIGTNTTKTQSTANPTQSLTTQDNNNWVVGGFSAHGLATFTASVGNLRGTANSGSGGTTLTGASMDNTAASPGSVTVTGTDTDANWAMGIIELRTVAPVAVQLSWHQPFSLPRDEIIGVVAN